jgi:hypothetical protein
MKILVSANHPGGANSILPVVEKLSINGEDLTVILEGKARDFFIEAGINFIDADSLSDLQIAELFENEKFNLFLAGTSLGLTVDKKLLAYCQKKRILSIYILDFWSNYWQRFSYKFKDFKFLPDYICVMDDFTKKEMINDGFSTEKIVVTGNPYFDTFLNGIDNCNEQNRILLISQPFIVDKEDLAQFYNERQVLEDILSLIPNTFNVALRLHPREEKNKFDQLIKKYKSIIFYDKIADLKKSLSISSLVIGVNSMVLFQAAMAGKKVISYQPGLHPEKDILISNRFGLSKLAISKENLKNIMDDFFSGKFIINQNNHQNIIKTEATKNVINFISNLKINVEE